MRKINPKLVKSIAEQITEDLMTTEVDANKPITVERLALMKQQNGTEMEIAGRCRRNVIQTIERRLRELCG